MIKFAFLALVVLGFGSFLILDSFAVDFVDSTGYNPSWAKGAGYHYVLNECNYMIGDTSRDGNWCYEWVAYVLDQGVENFPESTKTGSSSKSFTLEDGPLYSGDLVKLLPDKSNFGDDWQVGKPFTANNLEQMKSGGITDLVSQRIVIPDIWDDANFLKISFMIMEFENVQTTSEFYSKIKESVYSQNFPNREEYFELYDQGIWSDKLELERSPDYSYADCIGQINNYDRENEEAKLTCIEGNYLTAVMVSWNYALYNPSFTLGGTGDTADEYSEIMIKNIQSNSKKQIQKSTPEPIIKSKIPSWIKNNASWWVKGAIDDDAFVQGIQYLVKENILNVPPTSQGQGTSSNQIPLWIKNNAGWWAEGAIDDDAFVQGIQFLIKEGIITVESQSPAYEVSENYHFAAIMTNPYGMGTNTNIVLMIVDPDLSGTKKISLDKVKVEVNGVQIPISELNPLYANFIDNGSSTGIFLNEFDIERMFNKGDILEFEYFDETHYIDGGTGYSSSTFQIQ